MPDAATARREARQRRILENSQDRLQRITGKPSNTSHGASPLGETPSSDKEETQLPTSFILTSPVNGSTPYPEQLEGILHDAPELTDFVRNLTARPSAPQTPPDPPAAWEKLFVTKLDVILISIIIQIVYGTLDVGAQPPSIFMPLMVYELTKLWIGQRREDSGVVGTMLVMNGVSPDKVQSLMLATQIIFTLAQDVCIYIFFIVFTQSFYIFFFKKQLSLGTQV